MSESVRLRIAESESVEKVYRLHSPSLNYASKRRYLENVAMRNHVDMTLRTLLLSPYTIQPVIEFPIVSRLI